MGAGQSAPQFQLSRDSLLKSTQPMREVADAALRVMLERITPRDLLSLSSPSECNKYVIVIGSAFDQFFRSVDVVPVLKGKPPQTVYFQRADILTGRQLSSDPAYAAYRQNVCKALGYFFTKFFQIFAALSLSIFDDPNLRPGAYDPYRVLPSGMGVGARRYGSVLGDYPMSMGLRAGPGTMYGGEETDGYSSDEEKASEALQEGGGPSEDFLKRILDWNRPKRFRGIDGEYYDEYRLLPGGQTRSGFSIYYLPGKPIYDGRFSVIDTFNNKEKLAVRVLVKVAGDDVSISPRYIYKDNGTSYPADSNIYMKFRFTGNKYKLEYDEGTTRFLASGVTYNFSTAIRAMMDYFLGGGGSGNERDRDRDRYREREYNSTRRRYDNSYRDRDHWRRERERERDRERTRERLYDVYGSKSVPEEIRPIFTALQGQMRPVAHCVARSLQLINLDALAASGGRSQFSHICNYKFLDPHPTGLPAPGQALSSSPGLKSLETLFYVFQNNAVQISDANRQEYLKFMIELGKIYDNSPENMREGRFKELINQVDVTTCTRLGDTRQALALTGSQADVAKAAVMKLWAKQLEHTRAVDKIFAQMFFVDKATRQIRISPNILHLGIPGLDAIAANARSLLVKYYTDCESEYQKGVKGIIDLGTEAYRRIMQRDMAPGARVPGVTQPGQPGQPGQPQRQLPGFRQLTTPARPLGPQPNPKQLLAAATTRRTGGNYTRRNPRS